MKQLRKDLSRYIRRLRSRRKMQRQLGALIAALSVVVSGTVTWQLRETGSALNDDEVSADNDELIAAGYRSCETAAVWEDTLPDTDGMGAAESVAMTAESQIGYKEEQPDRISGEISAENMNAII